MASEEIKGWLTGRLPAGWYSGAPEIRVVDDEIWVIGTLEDVKGAEGGPDAVAAARQGRIRQHREETREQRMQIAEEAQQRFRRRLAWGAKIGDQTEIFTHLSVPVMTRLRLPERELLDTLVQAGIARSRSHALAWCVRLVEQHQSDWLTELRDALAKVGQARAHGPLN